MSFTKQRITYGSESVLEILQPVLLLPYSRVIDLSRARKIIGEAYAKSP